MISTLLEEAGQPGTGQPVSSSSAAIPRWADAPALLDLTDNGPVAHLGGERDRAVDHEGV